MRKFLLLFSLLAFSARAEYVGDLSNKPTIATNTPSSRNLGVRAADVINPRDYGAVGAGTSKTANSALGITTLNQLAAYSKNGVTPYSFINSYPHGVLFNLMPEVTATTGATSLTFKTTGTIQTNIATSAAATSGASSIVVGDKFVTIDKTAIAVGTAVSGTNIASGTTVTSVSGYSGAWTLGLSANITGNIASGALLTFAVRPASGTYSLPIVAPSGINQGDLVSGTCITTGTQVDYVNHAKNEIELSAPTTCQTAALASLDFIPSWLSNVTVGMTVQAGVGVVPANTTVTSVNTTTGVVGLSAALTGDITAATPIPPSGGSPTAPMPVAFYRPYSDLEAQSLEMDRLGIQAAINAAGSGLGGRVELPSNSKWLIDGALIMPIYIAFGQSQSTVTLTGQSKNLNGAFLQPTKDFGNSQAVISCGDPTGHSTNARGIYQGTAGYFCSGELSNVTIKPATYTTAYGLRPKWSGTPVAMDGMKQGPRLHLNNVLVRGFNNGSLFAGDHTQFKSFQAVDNFNGLRFDDQQPNLFGDEVFERLYVNGNAWAGISVSPNAYINGVMTKSYLSYNPYGIYCESGVGAGQCMQGVTTINTNAENVACGTIYDGGIQEGIVAAGGRRTIGDSIFINEINIASDEGTSNDHKPLGGCTWHAYYDVGYVNDLRIEKVYTNSYQPRAGAFAHILRVRRIDSFSGTGLGGFHMSGQGVWTAMQNARTFGQNFINSPNGLSGDFWFTGGWQFVTLEGSTFKARPIPFKDNSNPTSLPLGSLVEYGGTSTAGVQAVQLAGTTAGAAIAGSICQDWTGSNPTNSNIAPVVCVGGTKVPVLTASTATLGQYLKASTITLGTAVAATGVTDVGIAGVTMTAGTTSTLAYIRALWAGQN